MGFIMTKIGKFLNKKTEISHGQRLTICVDILCLMGIGFYLNEKLYQSRIRNINQDTQIEALEKELRNKGYSEEQITRIKLNGFIF